MIARSGALALLGWVALASMLTGLWPHHHGSREVGQPMTSGTTLLAGTFVHLAIGAWKGFFTLGDGARCPMRPTCSTYAQRAMTRDGAAGALLAFDRLMRDSNAAAYAPSPDGFHALDPLDDHAPALELLSGAYCRRQRADGSAACF